MRKRIYQIGVNTQRSTDAFQAGQLAVKEALDQSDIEEPDLVFGFSVSGGDSSQFHKGIRSVVGENVPIIGGDCPGLMTRSSLSVEAGNYAVAVMSSPAGVYAASADRLFEDEESAAARLGSKLGAQQPGEGPRDILLFYDSLRRSSVAGPPDIVASPKLLRGLEQTSSSASRFFGAGIIRDFMLGEYPALYGPHGCASDHAVAVSFPGGAIRHAITHGCTLLDGIYHTITASSGAEIFEIDNRPAAEVITEIYGNDEWIQQVPVRRLTLGINMGERFADFDASQFVNRLISGVLPDNKGIALFESDLPVGTEFTFMLRDADAMIQSATANTEALFKQMEAEGLTPRFGMYIDCAGRSSMFTETLEDEAVNVQTSFVAHGVPLLGIYSGVEIAPFHGKSRGLDWTGVILLWVDPT